MSIFKRHTYDCFSEAVYIGNNFIRVGWFFRMPRVKFFRCGKFAASYTLRICRFCISIKRFCSHCDDVVILRLPAGRWDVRHGVKCPVCRHNTADWIPDAPKPVDDATAARGFAAMKEAVK